MERIGEDLSEPTSFDDTEPRFDYLVGVLRLLDGGNEQLPVEQERLY